MARQKFGIKIIGTLDDVNFQRTGGKDIVKLKGGVEKARIMTDDKFVRTRENMSEFGRAGTESKGLVDALAPLISQAYDRYYFSRLLAKMKENLNTDAVNARGEREIQYSEFPALVNFAFNQKAKISNVLRAPYAISAGGDYMDTITFPQGINPKWDIKAPANATHFQLGLIVAGRVSEDELYHRAVITSDYLPLNTVIAPADPEAELVVVTTGIVGTAEVCVTALGIFFGQEVNGVVYPFHNKAYNALDIVFADTM